MKLKNAWKMLPLSGVAAFCLLASCSGEDYQSVVNSIVLSEDSTAVTSDFEIPTKVAEKDITWTSSDESVIKLVEEDGVKTAGVIRPTSTKTVTLTASIEKAKKDFTVTVNPVDVYEIADSYKFAEKGTLVYDKDITVPTSYTYEYSSVALEETQKYTATVAWSTTSDLVTISGTTAHVGNILNKTAANLVAKFSYGSVDTNYTYNFNVWKKLTPTEASNYWYDNPANGETFSFDGYVLAKSGYVSNYKECNLYIMNEDKSATYYVYNCYLGDKSEDAYNNLALGTKVSVKNIKSQTYHGLVESTYGSTVTILDDTALDITTVSAYAIDNELIVKNKELIYQQNNLTSLSGWKIKSMGKATADSTSTTQTLLTVTKNDVDVEIIANNNITKFADSADLFTTLSGLKVGNFIDVTGLYSYYDADQMIVTSAASITKVDAESKATIATSMNSALAKIDETVPTAFTKSGTITLPSPETGTITYSLKRSNYKTVTLSADNKLTATLSATSATENVVLNVSYTYHDDTTNRNYTVNKSYTIVSKFYTDADMAKIEADKVFADYANCAIDTVIDLNAAGSLYTDVVLTYTLVSGSDVASIVDGKLYVLPTATATDVVVKVTATLNDATFEEEYTITADLDYNTHAEYKTAFNVSDVTTSTFVTIKGVVTGILTNGKSVYVQDLENAKNGYFVYLSAKCDAKIGDVVYASGYGYTTENYGTEFYYNKTANVSVTISHAYNLDGTIKTMDTIESTDYATLTEAVDTFNMGAKFTVTGEITKVADSGDINYTITYAENKTVIYRADDGAVDAATFDAINAKLALNATVTVTGSLGWYKGGQIYIFSADDITVVENEANVTAFVKDGITSLVESEIEKAAKITLPTTTIFGGTVTYTVTGSAASLATNVLTITLPDADVKCTLTATYVKGDTTYTVTYEFTVKTLVIADNGTYTAKYTGTTTVAGSETTNYTNLLGLPAKLFTVTSSFNSATAVGFNADGTFRLYSNTSGDGTIISFKIASGYKITSAVIVFGTGKNGATEIKVNGTASTTATTTYAIDGDTLSIQNVTTISKGQIWIQSIAITYAKVTA